jgi:hypothetical protein
MLRVGSGKGVQGRLRFAIRKAQYNLQVVPEEDILIRGSTAKREECDE